MGKEGRFRKCKGSIRGIQGKDECGGEEIREDRYGKRERLQEGRTPREIYSENII